MMQTADGVKAARDEIGQESFAGAAHEIHA